MLARALALVTPPLVSRHRGRLWPVAVAPHDGQPRVLRVAGVRSGERAPEVDRVAAGRSQYSMAAAATKPRALPDMDQPIRHSLIMHAGPTNEPCRTANVPVARSLRRVQSAAL